MRTFGDRKGKTIAPTREESGPRHAGRRGGMIVKTKLPGQSETDPAILNPGSPPVPCGPVYHLHELQVGRRPGASLLPTSDPEGAGGLQFTAGEKRPL